MFPGLGKGINPRKMASMMKQMGIDVQEIENVKKLLSVLHRKILFSRMPRSA